MIDPFQDVNDTERIVPIPPNIDTVNTLFGEKLEDEKDMKAWLDERRPPPGHTPTNGEEMSISRVGRDLYEKIFKVKPTLLTSSHRLSAALHQEAVGQVAGRA